MTKLNNERGGTPWPFRRLPFNENMQQSNNSWRRRWKGFRGGRATGAKHVGRTVALRLGRLLENKKIEGGMGHLPLWWPPINWGTQQSTISRLRRWGGRWRGEAARAERVGGSSLYEPGVKWYCVYYRLCNIRLSRHVRTTTDNTLIILYLC